MQVLISTGTTFCFSRGFQRKVSIPFTPGNSFLQAPTKEEGWDTIRCQSPSHRGTHFYKSGFTVVWVVVTMCQSPSPRGTHFYSISRQLDSLSKKCQSPSPRGTHFYVYDAGKTVAQWRVSIPFTSGNSFLRV